MTKVTHATPSENAVNEQIALADSYKADGYFYPGLSYTDGVAAALRWMKGDTDEKPIGGEDE